MEPPQNCYTAELPNLPNLITRWPSYSKSSTTPMAPSPKPVSPPTRTRQRTLFPASRRALLRFEDSIRQVRSSSNLPRATTSPFPLSRFSAFSPSNRPRFLRVYRLSFSRPATVGLLARRQKQCVCRQTKAPQAVASQQRLAAADFCRFPGRAGYPRVIAEIITLTSPR